MTTLDIMTLTLGGTLIAFSYWQEHLLKSGFPERSVRAIDQLLENNPDHPLRNMAQRVKQRELDDLEQERTGGSPKYRTTRYFGVGIILFKLAVLALQ